MTAPTDREAARESRLDQSHALELAAALAGFVAEEAGISLLAIKGPVLAAQGLRPARIYADVDVWVRVAEAEQFVELLAERGWHERVPDWFSDRVRSHSVTLIHDRWPCDIDVHLRFPGFLASDDVVFDALWDARVEVEVAGRRIPATGPAGSAAILALHSLRQMWDDSKVGEYDYLLKQLADEPQTVDGLLDLAAVAGANETLAPLFRSLDVIPRSGFRATGRQVREWTNRRAHHSRTGQWISYLKQTPVRRWPRELATVLWPSPTQYLQDHPSASTARLALFRGRMARLAKGASGVGHILGERASAMIRRARD